MIVAILTLSTIFISIAFIITTDNAQYLLSGYNTMSEAERQNFDIKAYLVYFKKFHIFLGVSLLIGSLLLTYFVDPDWGGIFLGTYPILVYIYFIWKGMQFATNKTRKQYATTYIVMGLLSIILVAMIYAFINSLNDNEITVKDKTIAISGDYGTVINISDLISVELIDQLPGISSKTNGFALETVKKGIFSTTDGETVKLLVNSEQTPVILFITNDNRKLYYSSKDKSNQAIYKEIKRKMIK